MTNRIADPEVARLAAIAASLQADYAPATDDPWESSPFAWIRRLPSRQRGKVGEQLVAGWCAAKGLDVIRCPDAEADRIIEGYRVEIKFSTLWEAGTYRFQQIRDQNYDYVVCLGLSPFDAHCWVISKELLRQHVIGHTPQHAGRRGSDTFWIHAQPDAPHLGSRAAAAACRKHLVFCRVYVANAARAAVSTWPPHLTAGRR